MPVLLTTISMPSTVSLGPQRIFIKEWETLNQLLPPFTVTGTKLLFQCPVSPISLFFVYISWYVRLLCNYYLHPADQTLACILFTEISLFFLKELIMQLTHFPESLFLFLFFHYSPLGNFPDYQYFNLKSSCFVKFVRRDLGKGVICRFSYLCYFLHSAILDNKKLSMHLVEWFRVNLLSFPNGKIRLNLKAGKCNHKKYLIHLVRSILFRLLMSHL